MTAHTNLLTKVRGLIGLSASSYSEEARTSAYLACKMIREHGLHVVAQLLPARASKAEPRPDREPVNQAAPRRITLKYRARCRGCGGCIDVGARAVWMRGSGVAHDACWARRQS